MAASSEAPSMRKKKKPLISRKPSPQQEDDGLEDDEEEENLDQQQQEIDEDHQNPSSSVDRTVSAKECELLAEGGERMCDFPLVIKRYVMVPHSSVVNAVAMEMAGQGGKSRDHRQTRIDLENISYGQLQVTSDVPADSPALGLDGSGSGSYVITPPHIKPGNGVIKRFGNTGRVHVVPMHADWFSPNAVHELERQVVPHFFSCKSTDHTPEKYMECRNQIVANYIENPDKYLSASNCQGLVNGVGVDDITRIVQFLDHWGIINYCANPPKHELNEYGTCLYEDANGEVCVPSEALKSIDSLIGFDKPKCCEEYEGSSLQGLDSDEKFPFAHCGNPVMALVSFLASAVGPSVAASCARASLAALSDVNSLTAPGNTSQVDADLASSSECKETAPLSNEKVKASAKIGLAAASLKAKLVADHEEREIQRLSADIVHNQLKRLELKLKQFVEVETLLIRQCEQIERTRQQIVGTSMINNTNLNTRQPVVTGSQQPFISGFGNNQPVHPHMSFMPQQGMHLGLGPQLPLSGIHPSSSPASSNVMFNAAANSQSALAHSMLRPASGTKPGLG